MNQFATVVGKLRRVGGRLMFLPGRSGGDRGALIPTVPLKDLRDPASIGWDQQVHLGLAKYKQQTQVLDYSSAGSDAVDLDKDSVITAIGLVADPYRHDVTTATIVAVQDAVDKVISALSIVGGPTYFNLSNATLFLKALSAHNKLIYGSSITHEDLAVAVGADNDSVQAWHIPFGAFNDKDPFDITAGIPAEDETSLVLSATFGANNLIAVVAADGTVDANTDIYVIIYGVQGLSPQYRSLLPIPDFRFDHQPTPTATTTFNLEVSRYLKRTTIVNLAAVASNNEARNDSNITNISLQILKPTTTKLIDRVRWRVYKSSWLPFTTTPAADRDGLVAITGGGLVGVVQIDWRQWSKNIYGLNLYPVQKGDVQLILEMGTVTGSIHLFHEYYSLPDPSIADRWDNTPHRPR